MKGALSPDIVAPPPRDVRAVLMKKPRSRWRAQSETPQYSGIQEIPNRKLVAAYMASESETGSLRKDVRGCLQAGPSKNCPILCTRLFSTLKPKILKTKVST